MSSLEESSARHNGWDDEDEEEPTNRKDSEKVRSGTKRTRADEDEDDEERDSINDDEDEDEEGDGDEEEDEEDYDDEDNEYTNRTPRHTRKKRKGNMFLDVEAEVDEDEEDIEEEDDDLGGEDGFIQEHDIEAEGLDLRDDRGHRDLDRKRQEITDQDAERLAEEFREKYGRSSASRYRGDGAGVAQRLLLPSVDDPSIWAVKCKAGKERDIIVQILKKAFNMRQRGHPVDITSAFERESLQGYIYIEARKAAHLLSTIKDIPNIYASTKLTLIPIQEMPDLLRVKQQSIELTPGAYVRIKTKSSKYAGDLAQVDNVNEDGSVVRLRLVPRIDYSAKNAVTIDGKRMKKQPAAFRPPARLFNEAEALSIPIANQLIVENQVAAEV